MKWDYEGEYLKQFPNNFKGTIGDRFCRAVRHGCEDARSVLEWVGNDLAGNTNPVWQAVADSCGQTEAWEFAQHILDRESLSREEKQALKKASKSTTIWHDGPPSEKQLRYLQVLGCPIVPESKKEASDLIGHILTSKKEGNVVDYENLPF